MWLGRNSIVLSDSNQVVFDLFNKLRVTLSLIHWYEWMKIAKSIPSDWDHANSRVKLHSARTKRDHRVSQTQIFISKSLDVSHHVSLRELHAELILLHEFAISLDV
jgi:hypothetical protein